MTNLDLGRHALSVCAVAMLLTGCGGSQGLIGPIATGQPPNAQHAIYSLSAAPSSVGPLSLRGETLTASGSDISRHCTRLPPIVHFRVHGAANGPWIGTFKASGYEYLSLYGIGFYETFKITSGSHSLSGVAELNRGPGSISCHKEGQNHGGFDVTAFYKQHHIREGATTVRLITKSFEQDFR